MLKRVLPLVALIVVAGAAPGPGKAQCRHQRQDPPGRQAATRRSCGRCTILTDVYGPRVTGSPNLKAAGGVGDQADGSRGASRNGHLEPWDFGHPGWVERALLGAHRRAGEGPADLRSAGVDAGHRRHGHGAARIT